MPGFEEPFILSVNRIYALIVLHRNNFLVGNYSDYSEVFNPCLPKDVPVQVGFVPCETKYRNASL